MILLFFISISSAQNSDVLVNRHLQKTYQQQLHRKEKAKLMGETLDLSLPNFAEEDETTYGVIRQAPEENYPDFSKPSSTYSTNPLEQSRIDVYKQKQRYEYEQHLERSFKRQYIDNAEADGVKVHINQDNVVDDYNRSHTPPPKARRPSGQN